MEAMIWPNEQLVTTYSRIGNLPAAFTFIVSTVMAMTWHSFIPTALAEDSGSSSPPRPPSRRSRRKRTTSARTPAGPTTWRAAHASSPTSAWLRRLPPAHPAPSSATGSTPPPTPACPATRPTAGLTGPRRTATSSGAPCATTPTASFSPTMTQARRVLLVGRLARHERLHRLARALPHRRLLRRDPRRSCGLLQHRRQSLLRQSIDRIRVPQRLCRDRFHNVLCRQ